MYYWKFNFILKFNLDKKRIEGKGYQVEEEEEI